MLSRIKTLLSLNDPGWGRSGGRDGRSASQRPHDGPPDLDELWRDVNRRLNRLFGGSGGEPPGSGGGGGSSFKGGAVALGLALMVGALWVMSGFYIIQEGQSAAILRFGEFQRVDETAGFKWRWPYPIERAELVDVQRLRQVEVGYRSDVKNKLARESLVLTGDQAIVDVQFAVQYRISDPRAFLFNNNAGGAPEELVRQAAETAMREVIGRMGIDQVLYEEKEQVAKDSRVLMQAIADRYRAGILIVDVTIQQAQPPEPVQSAFEDANKAAQDRERLINEGRAYANDVIPKARGTAGRLAQEAEGYKQKVIASAEGDATRFKKVYAEYAKAPAVTRERLYLDTMQQVMTNVTKVLVDARSSSNLINLPLSSLLQNGAPDAARSVPAPAPEASAAATAPSPAPASAREGLRSRDREFGR